MLDTPKSLRLHIGIFGKTNVGKSSLINVICGQDIAIISDIAGTTTDPVEKSIELLPIGPVTFIDTAGIDDVSALGLKRIEKTAKIINRCDVAILMCDYIGFSDFEINLIRKFQEFNIPFLVLVNKSDIQLISEDKLSRIKTFTAAIIQTSLTTDLQAGEIIKQFIISAMPVEFVQNQSIIGDLISKNDTIVLVTPIDKEAPKGRLILPQVQVLRDVLDNEAKAIVVRETELKSALSELNIKPKLVITDSQAFHVVSELVPNDIPLTSFSILFARFKGDLFTLLSGTNAIKNLKNNSKILIAESCTHHNIEDDIATVKIPKWLKETTAKNLIFEYTKGHDFPENLTCYDLIIQCGGCMTNKKEILSRIYKANIQKIPITNYGLVIAYCKGILPRATNLFF